MNQFPLGGNVVWLKGGRTKQGTIYVMFRIGLRRNYKNKKTGHYDSDFAFCTAFDSKYRHLATFIGKNAKKGYYISFIGHIHTRIVTDNQGKQRDVNSIAVDDVDKIFPSMKAIQDGSFKQPRASNQGNYPRNSRPQHNNNQRDPFGSPNSNNGNKKVDIDDSDLPF